MCGIAGLLKKNGAVTSAMVKSMTDRMAHRGPDGEGVHVHEHIGLGHRRLSLIDLEGGVQPMTNEDRSVWITFNGELYNFAELKPELEAKGHVFKTRSDTEVIVHAYEEWGIDCLQRFRGMFAFCVLDVSQRRLFLARDHFGIKPLYFTNQDQFFGFASELHAFKGVEGFNADLDPKAIDSYLALQYIPAPQTVFKQVKKLKPAHFITVDFEGNVSAQTRYWDIAFAPNHQKSTTDLQTELEQTIAESVKAHLVSDQPFGAFLSGGLDSSVVVSNMAQQMGQPVKTFTIGFEEQDYSEMAYAEQVAKKWGTEHYTEIVKPDALGILPELVQHYGEPFGDSSAIPTYYVSQMARREVKMVLSGDGGDEAFAGYKTHTDFAHFEMRMQSSASKRKAYDLASKLMPGRYAPRYTLDKWMRYITSVPAVERQKLWRTEYHSLVQKSFPAFEEMQEHVRDFDIVQKLQYMDMRSYMTYDILTKVDIASMCHSLEVRTPLIDKKVWEMAAQIPWSANMALVDENNPGKGWQGKMLLKKTLEKHFPSDFIYRKKQGFALPISRWFAEGESTGGAIREILTAPDAQLAGWFDTKAIEKFIASGNFTGIWLLLFLEYWLKDYHQR